MKANLSRLLSRGSLHKTYVNAALWTKKSHNYINDTEIEVQRRRTACWEVGLNHTQYIGETVLQLFANYKRLSLIHISEEFTICTPYERGFTYVSKIPGGCFADI